MDYLNLAIREKQRLPGKERLPGSFLVLVHFCIQRSRLALRWEGTAPPSPPRTSPKEVHLRAPGTASLALTVSSRRSQATEILEVGDEVRDAPQGWGGKGVTHHADYAMASRSERYFTHRLLTPVSLHSWRSMSAKLSWY